MSETEQKPRVKKEKKDEFKLDDKLVHYAQKLHRSLLKAGLKEKEATCDKKRILYFRGDQF